jgi:hypothetical protein
MMILAEAVLGPAWVWLAFSETPSLQVTLGGILLLASLAVYYGMDIARQGRLPVSVSTM